MKLIILRIASCNGGFKVAGNSKDFKNL